MRRREEKRREEWNEVKDEAMDEVMDEVMEMRRMRRGKRRWRSIVGRCAVGVFLMLQPFFVEAQELKTDLIEILKESFADNSNQSEHFEESSWEKCIEHLEYFRDNPLRINVASRNELAKLGLLSDFQIVSILEYRSISGNILGPGELSMLHGFDDEAANMILPFITFDPKIPLSSNNGKPISSTVYLKSALNFKQDTTWIGSPFYIQAKYKLKYGNFVEAGLTLENDAGEPLFSHGAPFMDFISSYIAINDYRKLKSLIIGDFSARFGQGLTIWNGFSIHGATNPLMLYKRGDKLQPYSSSDENKFYRGIAASLSFNRFDISAMVSHKKLDAVVKDGKYTSITEDGLHNTNKGLSVRKKMKESVAGINLSYLLPALKIELSAIAYKYDKHNGKQIKDYNKYQMYNGIWGNFSLSFYSILDRWKIFGEMAMDYGASGALLAGASFPLKSGWEFGVLLRHYSKSYIAPHSMAYSTISTISNQTGITLHSVGTLYNNIKLYSETDFVYYPWKRFNIDVASIMAKTSIKLEHTGRHIRWSTKFSEKYTSHNRVHRLYGNAATEWQPASAISIKGCVSGVANMETSQKSSIGWMIGGSLKYMPFNGDKLTLQAGGCYFNCREWSCRLYQYEADLPYTYNNRLLYGEGGSIYLLAKFVLPNRIGLYAKGDTIQYTVKGKEPQNRLKLAIRYSF